MQWVPEFALRAKEQGWVEDSDLDALAVVNDLRSGDPARIEKQRQAMDEKIADAVVAMEGTPGLASVRSYDYDTTVVGKEQYGENIDRGTEGDNRDAGGEAPQQSITERLKGSVARMGIGGATGIAPEGQGTGAKADTGGSALATNDRRFCRMD